MILVYGLVYPFVSNSCGRPCVPHLASESVGFEVTRVIEPWTDRSRRCVTCVSRKVHELRSWFSSRVRVTLTGSPQFLLNYPLRHCNFLLRSQMRSWILFSQP